MKKTPSFILSPLFIVAVGLLLRLLVIPFTLNWDLWANIKLAADFSTGNLGQFYKQSLANYPPLMYITLKLGLSAVKPFSANLSGWIQSTDLQALTDPLVFRYLFLIKIPYLLFEIASAFIFVRLFDRRHKIAAYILWWWNPLLIFLVESWTNVDIFAVFFILASLRASQTKRHIMAVLLLCLGMSYKLFPVFLLPFAFLAIPKKKDMIIAAVSGVFLLALTHLPILFSPGPYLAHSITSGYRDLIFFSILGIGASRALIVVYFLYFLLLFLFIEKRQKAREFLAYYYFTVLAIIFALSKFGPNWFLWLVPLLCFVFIQKPFLRWHVLLIFAVFAAMIGFSQTSLNLGMLGPLEPTLWRIEDPLRNLLGDKSMDTIFNSLHTLFAATLFYISYKTLSFKNSAGS